MKGSKRFTILSLLKTAYCAEHIDADVTKSMLSLARASSDLRDGCRSFTVLVLIALVADDGNESLKLILIWVLKQHSCSLKLLQC